MFFWLQKDGLWLDGSSIFFTWAAFFLNPNFHHVFVSSNQTAPEFFRPLFVPRNWDGGDGSDGCDGSDGDWGTFGAYPTFGESKKNAQKNDAQVFHL